MYDRSTDEGNRMTDTEPRPRRMGYTSFPEAPTTEEGVAAVLVTKDDGGDFHAYVEEYPGRTAPHPEAVEMLLDATKIANL